MAQIGQGASTGNDESLAGFLHLFDPSNTTFVKHFLADTVMTDNYAYRNYFTQDMVTQQVQSMLFNFKSSGNIDSGVIKLYGVS